MFELKVHKPKDKQVWIQSIRSAVKECPEEEDDGYVTFSFEERQRQLETKKNNIREIVGTFDTIVKYLYYIFEFFFINFCVSFE